MTQTNILKLDSRQRLNMGRLLKNPDIQYVQVTEEGHGRYIIDTIEKVQTSYDEHHQETEG